MHTFVLRTLDWRWIKQTLNSRWFPWRLKFLSLLHDAFKVLAHSLSKIWRPFYGSFYDHFGWERSWNIVLYMTWTAAYNWQQMWLMLGASPDILLHVDKLWQHWQRVIHRIVSYTVMFGIHSLMLSHALEKDHNPHRQPAPPAASTWKIQNYVAPDKTNTWRNKWHLLQPPLKWKIYYRSQLDITSSSPSGKCWQTIYNIFAMGTMCPDHPSP